MSLMDSPPALERISISEFVAQLTQLSREDREELEQHTAEECAAGVDNLVRLVQDPSQSTLTVQDTVGRLFLLYHRQTSLELNALRKENELLSCSKGKLNSEVKELRHDLKLTTEALQECTSRLTEGEQSKGATGSALIQQESELSRTRAMEVLASKPGGSSGSATSEAPPRWADPTPELGNLGARGKYRPKPGLIATSPLPLDHSEAELYSLSGEETECFLHDPHALRVYPTRSAPVSSFQASVGRSTEHHPRLPHFTPPSSPPRGDKRKIGLPRLSCPSYQGHKAQFTTSSPRRVSASPPRRKAERQPRDFASHHGREAKLYSREPRREYSPSPPRHRVHGYSSRTQTTQLEESSHSDSDHTASYKPRRTTRFTDGPRLKQLDAIAKDIERFDPEKQDHNVEDYLREITHSLSDLPGATQREKIKLIWKTTSRSIHAFIESQPSSIRDSYSRLCRALMDEYSPFADETSATISAIQIKHRRSEHPREFYNRLRHAFFQGRNGPGLVEDRAFKSLFLHNLHPCVRTHVTLMTRKDNPSMRDIRRMAQMAWETVVRSNDKREEDQRVLVIQAPSRSPLELEGSEIPIPKSFDSHAQQNRPSHRDNATRGWKERQNKSKGGDDHQSRERKDNRPHTGQDREEKDHKGRGFRRDQKAKYREGRTESQAPAQWESELASIKDTLASLSKSMASLTCPRGGS